MAQVRRADLASRQRMLTYDPADALIEIARTQREAVRVIVARRAAGQFGEVFVGLDDDRRHDKPLARCRYRKGETNESQF